MTKAQTPEEKAAAKVKKDAAKVSKAAKNGGDGLPPEKTVTRVLTQEDFDTNPDLTVQGFKVGDEVEIADENADEPEITKSEIKAPKKNATAVDVIKNGQYIRTYSEEIHGEDFMDIAQGYADKSGSELVDADSITNLVVSYRAIDKKTGVQYATSKVFTEAANGEDFKAQAIAFRNSVTADTVTFK